MKHRQDASKRYLRSDPAVEQFDICRYITGNETNVDPLVTNPHWSNGPYVRRLFLNLRRHHYTRRPIRLLKDQAEKHQMAAGTPKIQFIEC